MLRCVKILLMEGAAPQIPTKQATQPITKEISNTLTKKIRNFIKSPRVSIPIIIYLILLGPTLYLYSSSPPETKVQTYKGAWYPIVLPSHFSEMKKMGFNTIFTRGDPGEGTVNLIQAAHRNGLKVALTTDFSGPYLKGVDKDSEYWTLHIIETAKMAERYGVEFFAPSNEPNFGEDTSKWAQEILSKIRGVYSGEVIWKGAEVRDVNLLGYDYIGFTIGMDENATSEEYSRHVDSELDKALGFCQRDSCKGVMVTEFGSWQNHGQAEIESGIFEIILGEGKHTVPGKEDITRAYEIVFERGKDKAVGYFFFNEYPGVSSQFKEVIKKWYKEIL